MRCQSPYHAEWYETVIETCGLQQDLAILPDGDETVVGSKGITLSGGQKQRLALARVLYAKEDIVILDDIFSGLDADTEDHIFSKLFSADGLFRKLATTVIFATHAVHRLPQADHIIALAVDGSIVEQGAYASLAKAGGYVQNLASKVKKQGQETPQRTAKAPSPSNKKVRSAPAIPIGNAARTTGDWKTYAYYFKSAGITSTALSCVWSLLFILSTKLPGLLVTYWTDVDAEDSTSANILYLSLFGVLAAIAFVTLFLDVWQVYLDMIPRSSNGLHYSLLQTAMRAPLSFFTKTDSGTTLNR